MVKDIIKFIDLYESGLSRKEACLLSGIPEGSGSYILRKHEIKTRAQGFQVNNTIGVKFQRKHFENIKRNCLFCDNEFEINVYKKNGYKLDKVYCSKTCADKGNGLKHRGSNHWNWQGGKPRLRKGMNSIEYKMWRKQVFERDDYTCQKCGARGCILNAHHIKPWAKYEELRYVINNGITLCKNCHINEHRTRHR